MFCQKVLAFVHGFKLFNNQVGLGQKNPAWLGLGKVVVWVKTALGHKQLLQVIIDLKRIAQTETVIHFQSVEGS